MRILPFICLLVGCCFAAPSLTEGPETIAVDSFITEDFVIYTAKHDIVKIFAPTNQFTSKHDLWADMWSVEQDSNEKHEEKKEHHEHKEKEAPRKLFIVEADISNGKQTEQGLYIYLAGTVTKLLDNGRDAVANNEHVVYLGASDGIYKYNEATNKAEKHGAITDDIVQLAFYNVTNTIFYVTANHEVFQLNTEATTSEKVSQIKDVQALVFGYDRKIYYYDSAKNVYVYDHVNNVGPKKIEGLPASIDRIALVSPFMGMEEGAILLVNKEVYVIKPDATASKTQAVVEGNPTAYEPKPTCHQFYAQNKKLYELDIMTIIDKLGVTGVFH